MPALSPYQKTKQRTLARLERDREKDMAWRVTFHCKSVDASISSDQSSFEPIWIRHSESVDEHEILDRASEVFQIKQSVSDWRELASKRTAERIWYP